MGALGTAPCREAPAAIRIEDHRADVDMVVDIDMAPSRAEMEGAGGRSSPRDQVDADAVARSRPARFDRIAGGADRPTRTSSVAISATVRKRASGAVCARSTNRSAVRASSTRRESRTPPG
jgi:hypothetical protein